MKVEDILGHITVFNYLTKAHRPRGKKFLTAFKREPPKNNQRHLSQVSHEVRDDVCFISHKLYAEDSKDV